MKNFFISLRLLAVLTILTGILYPASLIAFGMLFPEQANGSLVYRQGRVIGSKLLAQKNESPRYFQLRPSASDYATVPSGASNFGPTSKVLREAIEKRRTVWGNNAPVELLTTSGSGLDPHISPETAYFQAPRVAAARGMALNEVRAIVEKYIESSQFGFLGEPRVSILQINLALDDASLP